AWLRPCRPHACRSTAPMRSPIPPRRANRVSDGTPAEAADRDARGNGQAAELPVRRDHVDRLLRDLFRRWRSLGAAHTGGAGDTGLVGNVRLQSVMSPRATI